MTLQSIFQLIVNWTKHVCKYLKEVTMSIKLFSKEFPFQGKNDSACAGQDKVRSPGKQRHTDTFGRNSTGLPWITRRNANAQHPRREEHVFSRQSPTIGNSGAAAAEKLKEDQRAAIRREIFASSGPLAATAVMLASLRSGSAPAAESMHRQVRNSMNALRDDHNNLDELMRDTEHAQLIQALDAISAQDFTMDDPKSFEVCAQEQIERGLEGLSAQTRMELLNTAEFAALRPAFRPVSCPQEPEQSE